jgi:hypothetical protein
MAPFATLVVAGKRPRSNVVRVHPDIEGIQEIGRRLCRGERVSVPTECTYEVLQQHQPLSMQQHTAATTTCAIVATRPHIYIPDVSVLDTCHFWKQILVKKSYAIKAGTTSTTGGNSCGSIGSIGSPKSPSSMTTIATFNESVQVVRRIAAKVWPGPMILYVQVPQPIPGLTVTVHTSGATEQCYTSESSVQHYLALRQACHPLTVKVCREFYSQRRTTSPSSSPQLGPFSTPPASPRSPPTRVASCSSLSSGTVSSLSLAALLDPSTTTHLLVGSAMPRGRRPSLDCVANNNHPDDHKFSGGSTEYVTTAVDPAVESSHVTAVLMGEERREIFAVPTCAHGQPCPVTLWIDADTRTVRIQTIAGTRNSGWRPPGDHPRQSPDSVTGGVSQWQSAVTELSLQQALRTVKAVTNAKERVLQAVLLKWKVVREQH